MEKTLLLIICLGFIAAYGAYLSTSCPKRRGKSEDVQ